MQQITGSQERQEEALKQGILEAAVKALPGPSTIAAISAGETVARKTCCETL